ncbi:DUF4760 domain-containing protein [Blastococcus sp. PRF04-17]|uniref:DUF4760 domain-containing protein n=1 Tax=Blastococcus sp. PRF04-17 TaxID=2933797 RepID=UPI001FF21FB5|nr:DUF4760 domain-containing protein [Blastococcus sp. PRF04-17]UOY03746.1 DUF4760 domain-containing protein [Blastococcus sp. PRF04-17]
MNRFRLWLHSRRSVIRLTLLALLFAGAITAVVIVFGVDAAKDWGPVLAVTVAVFSLLVTASASVLNWQRQKREATIRAWREYSDSRSEQRKALIEFFGTLPLTDQQAEVLITEEGTLVGRDGKKARPDKRSQTIEDILFVLNGLEHLAVGARLGVYDIKVFRTLAGTNILAAWTRFEPYIKARRTARNLASRQTTAWVQFEAMVREVRREDLAAQERQLDHERVQWLRDRTSS